MKRVPLLTLVLAACGGGEQPSGPSPSVLRLIDATEASGLGAFQHANGSEENRTIDESFGAGVALFDADGDGDLDAYLLNGGVLDGAPVGNAFFRNDGRGHFTDETQAVGLGDTSWSYGVLARDFDGDGDTDLYVTNRGPNRLYENRDGVFIDVAAQRGVDDGRWSTGACFFDYDRDGDLDLYVANHIALDRAAAALKSQDFFGLEVYDGPLGLEAQPDALYRQEDDGSFTDVTAQMGIDGVAYFAFQVVVFDWDGDGWLDLYVANDSNPNLLWHNQAGAGFVDVAVRKGVALSASGDPQAGMGVAVGDADGDGRVDLYVTNFSEDYFTLYQGMQGGMFRDVTAPCGLYRLTLASLGWAALFEDLDSDGDLDLFAANGHVFPQVDQLGRKTRYLQRNQLFENGGAGRFTVPADGGGPGLALEAASRGAAVGDVDGDGDRDLLVGNLGGPPSLLINESRLGAALVLELVGAGKNKDAIGARVVARVLARAGELSLARTVGDGSGFLSSSSLALHLGLGDASAVDGVTITWPDGTEEQLGALNAGRRYTVTQGQGVTAEVSLAP